VRDLHVYAAAGVALLVALGMGWFAAVSARERERRASWIGAIVSLGMFLAAAAAVWSPAPLDALLSGALLVAAFAAIVLFLLPLRYGTQAPGEPTVRVDERDIMFARARLAPGSPEFDAYYAMRPENRGPDDLTRALPGLGSPRAGRADRWAFAAMEASFCLTEAVRDAVDGPVAPERVELRPEIASVYAMGLARYWGARDAGVTELRPPHVYSHVGRGSGVWGSPIELPHRFAVALTVEMAYPFVRTGPDAPEVMESAHQYVEAGRVALQLAYLIRSLGYPARAHIDGDYQVIAPLVARDAGLGEIGRMGLLMTPRLGPRVRLAVVTTDLPLRVDTRPDTRSVLDFCRICKKCAENCPSRSIPMGDRADIAGALRWKIDADTCFRFWNSAGTDCGRCMSVCPYSHPDTGVHNVVRWGIGRSGAARRAALWFDDLFYGRRPSTHPPPDWLPSACRHR
jgi:ferredoxin